MAIPFQEDPRMFLGIILAPTPDEKAVTIRCTFTGATPIKDYDDNVFLEAQEELDNLFQYEQNTPFWDPEGSYTSLHCVGYPSKLSYDIEYVPSNGNHTELSSMAKSIQNIIDQMTNYDVNVSYITIPFNHILKNNEIVKQAFTLKPPGYIKTAADTEPQYKKINKSILRELKEHSESILAKKEFFTEVQEEPNHYSAHLKLEANQQNEELEWSNSYTLKLNHTPVYKLHVGVFNNGSREKAVAQLFSIKGHQEELIAEDSLTIPKDNYIIVMMLMCVNSVLNELSPPPQFLSEAEI